MSEAASTGKSIAASSPPIPQSCCAVGRPRSHVRGGRRLLFTPLVCRVWCHLFERVPTLSRGEPQPVRVRALGGTRCTQSCLTIRLGSAATVANSIGHMRRARACRRASPISLQDSKHHVRRLQWIHRCPPSVARAPHPGAWSRVGREPMPLDLPSPYSSFPNLSTRTRPSGGVVT